VFFDNNWHCLADCIRHKRSYKSLILHECVAQVITILGRVQVSTERRPLGQHLPTLRSGEALKGGATPKPGPNAAWGPPRSGHPLSCPSLLLTQDRWTGAPIIQPAFRWSKPGLRSTPSPEGERDIVKDYVGKDTTVWNHSTQGLRGHAGLPPWGSATKSTQWFFRSPPAPLAGRPPALIISPPPEVVSAATTTTSAAGAREVRAWRSSFVDG